MVEYLDYQIPSRVPRLSDTRHSAQETKGRWRYAGSKARLKCAAGRWRILISQGTRLSSTSTIRYPLECLDYQIPVTLFYISIDSASDPDQWPRHDHVAPTIFMLGGAHNFHARNMLSKTF